jgi:hypothetical protein
MIMGSYSADITEFVRKTGIKSDVILRKLALQALRGVVLKTPVLTGRLRGNWRLSLNRIDLTADWNKKDPVGAKTIDEGNNTIAQAHFGDVICISNNLPYAQKIEDGGSPVKAPEGMLKVTFQEIKIGLQVMLDSVKYGALRD